MAHIVLASQTDLNRQLVPEPVAVRDVERMVLRLAVEGRVVGIEFRNMRSVGVVVMRVSQTGVPSVRVTVSGFQTAMRRRFPFVVGFDLYALVFAAVALILIGRVRAVYLGVVGCLVPAEVIVRTADIELVAIQRELIIDRSVTARVRTR